MATAHRIALAVSTALLLSAGPATPRDIPKEWVGRYQAKVVQATSGMDNDRVSTFGKGPTQTTFSVQTQACATEFDMEVRADGSVSGKGKLMYVYRGTAGSAVTALAPGGLAAGPGGFAMNLKDGKQFRDWNFSGTVSPEGIVELQGIPDTPMDYLNVGKWEKHRPWSALPPVDKAHMRGPFRMTLKNEGAVPTVRVDQFLQIDDALIKRVHYQAAIYRSDAPNKPACRYDEPSAPKCPATEYIRTKATIGVEGLYAVESSRDMKSGETSVTSKAGGGEFSGGFSTDSAGNAGWEGSAGIMVGSTQFNPTDGSYSLSVGVGLDTASVVPGPLKLSQKVELVYDSACGVGIRASGGVTAGAVGSGVEGAIFLTKGP